MAKSSLTIGYFFSRDSIVKERLKGKISIEALSINPIQIFGKKSFILIIILISYYQKY